MIHGRVAIDSEIDAGKSHNDKTQLLVTCDGE